METDIINEPVDTLINWLNDQRTGSELVDLIKSYLMACGKKTLEPLLRPGSELSPLAHFHDRLGWDSVLKDRICKLWVEATKVEISLRNIRSTFYFFWLVVYNVENSRDHP